MSAAAPDVLLHDVLFGERVRLEDLIDRDGLEELCKSFVALFGIPVRISSVDGGLLVDSAPENELCAAVNASAAGRKACASIVAGAKSRDPGEAGEVLHGCFTGATYQVVALDYDGRRVGRLIMGPFVPATAPIVPPSLLSIDPSLDRARAQDLLDKMPRAKLQTVTRIAAHLKAALDLLLFSGHKALVTSQMHLASVRESYRELEEKNARLQDAFDRLKELDRLKSSFLATVSHELRTPLTSIIGYSEMLAEGLAGDLRPEQLEFVRTIHEKGGQLLSLIVGLLDLGKLESGTMRMKLQIVGVGRVLHEVVSTLTPAARKKDVELSLDVSPDVADVRADPERLRQVFLNLVENAIKFTPSGGQVSLAARMVDPEAVHQGDEEGLAVLAPARGHVEVRVSDSGIGIPVRERSKVFDAFYQVDSSSTREYGGTGLGLSIVKRLVEAHGGAVHIEDNEPKGTVFVVALPRPAPSMAEESRVA